VTKTPLGGGAVTTLAQGQSRGITVDSTSVYVADNGDGLVLEVPISGGSVTTLASGLGPEFIAVDSTSVYWTDESGKVMKAPK